MGVIPPPPSVRSSDNSPIILPGRSALTGNAGKVPVARADGTGYDLGAAGGAFPLGMTRLITHTFYQTNTGGGTATAAIAAATGSNGGNPAAAFDGNPAVDYEAANATVPQWVQAQLTAALAVNTYTIAPRAGWYDQAPRDWTLQGSNDGATWTVLDTRAGISFTTDAAVSFSMTNTTAYLYYRLNVTAINGSSARLSIGEITLTRGGIYSKLTADGNTWAKDTEYHADPAAAPGLLYNNNPAGIDPRGFRIVSAGWYQFRYRLSGNFPVTGAPPAVRLTMFYDNAFYTPTWLVPVVPSIRQNPLTVCDLQVDAGPARPLHMDAGENVYLELDWRGSAAYTDGGQGLVVEVAKVGA